MEIDIPKDHQTTTFNLGDKEYPEGFIPAGKQRLKTMEVMRYILAEDREPQGKIDERSYRKNQAMGVLMEVIKGKVGSNPAFLWQISQFLKQERTAKNIIIDFDINLFSVAISGMGGMKNIIKRLVGSFGANLKSSFPKINKEQQFVFMTLFGVTGE